MKKKIMVVTSTRADWGLLKPVAEKIEKSDKLSLCLVVTGTHLLSQFGNTVSEIEADGFSDYITADIFKFGFGEKESALTIGYTVTAFTQIISRQKPDLVLVLGDRYEIFAVACRAAALSVPLAHISGGDVTLGAKDDFYRHCITKMSNLHFPSNPDSYRRVIQMGEDPATVFKVGGLGNENIKNAPLMSKEELEQNLEFSLQKPYALITYHPETRGGLDPVEGVHNLLRALDKTDINLIFTASNADAYGDVINKEILHYCMKNPGRAVLYASLGMKRYLSAMKYASLVLGNSSSGVVETPAFKVPTVNIGDRQRGRYIAKNVITTGTDTDSILAGIEMALSEGFKEKCRQAENPYDAGTPASVGIVKGIEDYLSSPHNTAKKFYDINPQQEEKI